MIGIKNMLETGMRLSLFGLLALVASGATPTTQTGDQPSLATVVELLESGSEPVRIVCFGDSITGVYYHTGGQRAWCAMLEIALQQLYPQAKLG